MDAPSGHPLTRPATALALGLGLAAFVSVRYDLVPALRGPAPYPPEWQWDLRSTAIGPVWPGWACAFVTVALLWLSTRSFARRHATPVSRGLVAAAVCLSAGMQLALLSAEPAGMLRTLIGRTLSRSITSYHTVAISPEARDPIEFLRRHASLLPGLLATAKHASTHPPGPVLYYRALHALCETSPRLTDAVLDTAGVPRRDFAPPATRVARASALVGALGLVFFCALTAWPLARLAAALGLHPLASARAALLWALLPGPALMVPQFDQALALPLTLAALALVRTTNAPSARRRVAAAVLAGLAAGIALFTSYGAGAFLSIAGMAAFVAAGIPLRQKRRILPSRCWGLALAAVIAMASAFLVPALLGHEPLRALRTALAIHREAFTAQRSYAVWLLFNPLDLAVFLGIPLAVLAAARLFRALGKTASGQALARDERFSLAVAAGIVVLVLLGVTRGEVGRIWIPLMPLVLGTVTGAEETDGASLPLLGGVLAALTLMLHSRWVF